ncbi:MAG: DUF389 domain-containing protein [Candidatus Zixiibacteriota bacterium]|nr:MAG: DUF389 domain-containing protein [candidate division Zixibacteria bacterium]
MPKSIQFVVSTERTDDFIERLRQRREVIGLSLHRDASVKPPGDVVVIQCANDDTGRLIHFATESGAVRGGSFGTSTLESLAASQPQENLDRETNEAIWEEMDTLIRNEANLTPNYLAFMGLSGAVAAVGLWSNLLHVVIAGMVLAPGFFPLVRSMLGVIAGPRGLVSRGLLATLAGYGLLGLAAALTAWLLVWLDPAATTNLETRPWVRYWSSISASGLLLSALAAMAGGLVVTTLRRDLEAGVMIALALVPSMGIAGMALALGDLSLAGSAFLRWVVDVAEVLIFSGIVLLVKQLLFHRRKTLVATSAAAPETSRRAMDVFP